MYYKINYVKNASLSQNTFLYYTHLLLMMLSDDKMSIWQDEVNYVGTVTQCPIASNLMIAQEEDHLLPDLGWPQVTKTTEGESADKEGLLYTESSIIFKKT